MAMPPLPDRMKAVLLTGHGGLEMLKYVADYPVPRPARGEVTIEVAACGMNNTDVWVREAAYGSDDDPAAKSSWRRGNDGNSTLTFPRIQGCDTVGRIVAVGDGVAASRIGDRVLVDFSIYNAPDDYLGDIDYMGHGRDGGYAEYMSLPAENAHAVRSAMTDIELATFCCAYLTGEHMLDRARLGAGERVLVTGASGGVGSGLIQLARARGAIPYAIVGPGKEQAVLAIGAEAVVTRTDPEIFEKLLRLTDGALFDVAADVVAGPLFNLCLKALKPQGRYTTASCTAPRRDRGPRSSACTATSRPGRSRPWSAGSIAFPTSTPRRPPSCPSSSSASLSWCRIATGPGPLRVRACSA